MDWSDKESVEQKMKKGFPHFIPKVTMWNSIFNIPFSDFRQMLKSIATENHRNVKGAIYTSSTKDIPSNSIIIPTDDDDWFAPDLACRVQDSYGSIWIGYLWRRYIVGDRGEKESLRRDCLCETNNYALNDATLPMPSSSWEYPSPRYPLLWHTGGPSNADAFFRSQPKDLIKEISPPNLLAVWNMTMASQTSLQQDKATLTREEIIEIYLRYKDLYRSWNLPDELSWAIPHMRSMSLLMDVLHII